MFSSQKFIAVEIGNRFTRVLEARVNKDAIVVGWTSSIDTPPGSIWEGNINDIRVIIEAIKLGLPKKEIPKGTKLILVMSGMNIIIRDLMLPKASDDEIDDLAYYEAQQFLPSTSIEYDIHGKVVEEVQEGDGTYYKMLLAAVPKKMAEIYMRIPAVLNAEIEAIDLNSNCIWKYLYGARIINKRKAEIKGDEIVVDFGHRTTNVFFFSDGILKFNRILSKGSENIDEAIAEAKGISLIDAEAMKIKEGYLTSGDMFDEDEDNNEGITLIVRPTVINMLNEINRLLEFYVSRNNLKKIDKIWIMGGGSLIKGMDKFMNIYFGIPVEYVQPRVKVEYSGRGKKEDFLSSMHLYANLIGSLIRDEI